MSSLLETILSNYLLPFCQLGSLAYLAYSFIMVVTGRDEYWSYLILPLFMTISLWKPSREGWWFLRCAAAVQSIEYGLFSALLFYQLLLWLAAWDKGYPQLAQFVLRFMVFAALYFLTGRYRERFAPEERFLVPWRKWAIVVVALSIPFLSAAEARVKIALDPTIIHYEREVTGIALSPDGKQLAVLGFRSAAVYDLDSRKKILQLPTVSLTSAAAFSRDGKYLVIGKEAQIGIEDNEYLDVWDLSSRQKVVLRRPQASKYADYTIRALTFSPDGRSLATLQTIGDGVAYYNIWDTQTWELVKEIQGSKIGVARFLAYSADGRYLATARMGRTIELLDVTSGSVVRDLSLGIQGTYKDLAFSPDGRYLAAAFDKAVPAGVSKAGSDKGTIQIWDTTTWGVVRILEWDSDRRAYSLSYSPDGKYLASCGDEKVVRVWNALTDEQVKELKGHPYWLLRGVCYSADGRRLAVGGAFYVKIWNMQKENFK